MQTNVHVATPAFGRRVKKLQPESLYLTPRPISAKDSSSSSRNSHVYEEIDEDVVQLALMNENRMSTAMQSGSVFYCNLNMKE